MIVNNALASFNRTFMELKYALEVKGKLFGKF